MWITRELGDVCSTVLPTKTSHSRGIASTHIKTSTPRGDDSGYGGQPTCSDNEEQLFLECDQSPRGQVTIAKDLGLDIHSALSPRLRLLLKCNHAMQRPSFERLDASLPHLDACRPRSNATRKSVSPPIKTTPPKNFCARSMMMKQIAKWCI